MAVRGIALDQGTEKLLRARCQLLAAKRILSELLNSCEVEADD